MGSSLYDNILSLNLPKDIQEEAFKKIEYLKLSVCKGKRVNSVTFFVIYEAYRKLHKTFDPVDLAVKTHIKPENINKKLKEFYRMGIKPVLVYYVPEDFISEYCIYTDISPEEYDNIKQLVNMLYKTRSDYKDKCPRIIAAGAVLYYAFIKGYITNEKQFAECMSKCTGWSSSVILEIKNNIEIIHNKT